jgi:hypothetical protein
MGNELEDLGFRSYLLMDEWVFQRCQGRANWFTRRWICVIVR